MNHLVAICFTLVICSTAFNQSKMKRIRDLTKEKVESKRDLEKKESEKTQTNNEKKQDSFSTHIFPFYDNPYDEISPYAFIQIYDGRFLNPAIAPYTFLNENRQGDLRLGFDNYPFASDKFMDSSHSNYQIFQVQYHFSDNVTDSLFIHQFRIHYDVDFLFFRANYLTMIGKTTAEERIQFSFLSMTVGLFQSFESFQSQIFLFLGGVNFKINSIDYVQNFGGTALGFELKNYYFKNISFQLSIEKSYVKDKIDDLNYFMDFTLTEITSNYHLSRFYFSLGYAWQNFNNIGNDNESFVFHSMQFGIGFYL